MQRYLSIQVFDTSKHAAKLFLNKEWYQYYQNTPNWVSVNLSESFN